MERDLFLSALRLANQILSSAILITAFSLVLYIFRHNYRSAVGRAFCILLTFVMAVYVGDVTLYEVSSPALTLTWLKFQWLGIAFVPAVYLHFSDALLNVTNSLSRWRRAAVRLSYLGSALTLLLVIQTSWVVQDNVIPYPVVRLQAGPLFWVFSLYFFATVISGALNINRARVRCLTSTSRRRMAYLAVSFVAPALGVFPYMLFSSAVSGSLSETVLMAIVLLGNVGIMAMIIVMAYAVAYFGAFNPDRVIKYGLIEYLLRGPVVASLVLVILVTVPKIELFLGLPGDLATLFATVFTIIMAQIGISLARPFLNRLVYRQDLEEVTWLQQLNTRLLTPSDLQQFLENVLSSLAELLRVRHAFVTMTTNGDLHLEAFCGDKEAAQEFLSQHDLTPMLQEFQSDPGADATFRDMDGYVLRPLCTQSRDAVVGLLVIERWPLAPDVDEQLESDVLDLIEQAEAALADRNLQQGIFVALQQIMPDIERLQKRRRLMNYVTSLPQLAEASPVDDPAFVTWVKDALSHYWGGPKLTQSPLLSLRIVSAAREQFNGDAVRALRTVLEQAIEALRPDGRQSMTASEWTLYNILDLKFRQGYRMRDIAERMAVSESDLYRKQRTAIDEVARMLVTMERRAT